MPYANKAEQKEYNARYQRERRRSDPIYAERQRALVRKRSKERWADPEYRFRKLKQRAAIRYGITVEEYDALFEVAGNKCGICGTPHTDKPYGRLNVDHCHETGKVRGVLCSPCNTGLGNLGDDIKSVKLALAYLEKVNE
jgi:hypothetical protein